MITVLIPYHYDLAALKQTLSINLKQLDNLPVTQVYVCDITSDPQLREYLDHHFPQVSLSVAPLDFSVYAFINYQLDLCKTSQALLLSPYCTLSGDLTELQSKLTTEHFAVSPTFTGNIKPHDMGVSRWILDLYQFKPKQLSTETENGLSSISEFACLIDMKKWQILKGLSPLFFGTQNPMVDLCYRALKRGWGVQQSQQCQSTFILSYNLDFNLIEQTEQQLLTARLMRIKNNTTPLHQWFGCLRTLWHFLTFRIAHNRRFIQTLKCYKLLAQAKQYRQPDIVTDTGLNKAYNISFTPQKKV